MDNNVNFKALDWSNEAELHQLEKHLFQMFIESDRSLRVFLQQAIALSDEMMSRAVTADDKIAWLEMALSARKLDLAACERLFEQNKSHKT